MGIARSYAGAISILGFSFPVFLCFQRPAELTVLRTPRRYHNTFPCLSTLSVLNLLHRG